MFAIIVHLPKTVPSGPSPHCQDWTPWSLFARPGKNDTSGGMCSAQGLQILGLLFSLDKKMLVLVSWWAGNSQTMPKSEVRGSWGAGQRHQGSPLSHEQRRIRSQKNGRPETNPRVECLSPHPFQGPPLTSFRVMILGCCPYRRRISISSEGSRLLLSMT